MAPLERMMVVSYRLSIVQWRQREFKVGGDEAPKGMSPFRPAPGEGSGSLGGAIFCDLEMAYFGKSEMLNLKVFYRAMHFSAKRGIAIAWRLFVCPFVTLVDCDHIGWNSSKIISPLVSPGCSLFATPTWRVCSKGNAPKFGPKVTHTLVI